MMIALKPQQKIKGGIPIMRKVIALVMILALLVPFAALAVTEPVA